MSTKEPKSVLKSVPKSVYLNPKVNYKVDHKTYKSEAEPLELYFSSSLFSTSLEFNDLGGALRITSTEDGDIVTIDSVEEETNICTIYIP